MASDRNPVRLAWNQKWGLIGSCIGKSNGKQLQVRSSDVSVGVSLCLLYVSFILRQAVPCCGKSDPWQPQADMYQLRKPGKAVHLSAVIPARVPGLTVIGGTWVMWLSLTGPVTGHWLVVPWLRVYPWRSGLGSVPLKSHEIRLGEGWSHEGK